MTLDLFGCIHQLGRRHVEIQRPRHLSKRYQWSFEAKSPVKYRSFLEAHHMDLRTYFCSPASFRMKNALSLPILQANQRHFPDIQLISTHSNPGIARIACLWRGTLIFIPLKKWFRSHGSVPFTTSPNPYEYVYMYIMYIYIILYYIILYYIILYYIILYYIILYYIILYYRRKFRS